MQLVLTASDLAAMPPMLRHELIDFMATRREARSRPSARQRRSGYAARAVESLAALDLGQATTLVRSVSFGRGAQTLHDLLRALAYANDADAPRLEELLRLLSLDDRRELGRRLAAISRRATAATHRSAPIARYLPSRAAYVVHPTTRASLRDVFADLKRPKVSEEPPWA